MKKLFLINFLIFLYSFTWGQSAPLVLSTKVTINSVTVFTDPYTVTGTTNDVTSNWTASDIAAGDSLYLEDGSELRVYQVVSISSAVGTAFTIVINDLNNTGSLPTTGVGALYRGTTNYDFPVWTAGISETLQSMIDNRFKQRLDSQLFNAGMDYITTDSFSTFISSNFQSVSFSSIPVGSTIWRTTTGNRYQKTSSTAMTLRSSINGANASTILGVTGNTMSFSARLNAHVRLNTTGNPTTATINAPLYNSASSVTVGSEYLIGITAGTNDVTITWNTIYGLYNKDSGFSNLGTTFVPAQSTVEYKFRIVVGAAETIRLQLTDNVGSGTVSQPAGQVVYGTGASVASSANLFWNTSNGNLGIGTNNPNSSQKLHVAGAARIEGSLTWGSSANGTAPLQFSYSTAPSSPDPTGKNIGYYTYNAAAEKNYAFVGDAATNATGTSVLMSLEKGFTSASAGNNTSLSITPAINQTGGGTGVTRGVYIAPSLTAPTDYRSLEMTANHANAYGVYQTGVLTRNYFAGVIGAGTSNPTYQIHAVNTQDANTAITVDNFSNTASASAGLFLRASATAGYEGILRVFPSAFTGVTGWNNRVVFQAGSNLTNGLLFYSTNGVQFSATGTDTKNLYLSAGGNVGINTGAPSEKLDVAGNVKFSGALMPNNLPGTSGQVLTSGGAGAPPTWTNPTGGGNLSGTGNIGSGGVQRLAFWKTGTTLDDHASLVFDTINVRVGIGTTAPGTKLQVTSGDATDAISGRSDNASAIAVTGYSASGRAGLFSAGGDKPVLAARALTGLTGNVFQWQDNAGTGLGGITAAGSMGIGTTAPAYPLDVVGNGKFSGGLGVGINPASSIGANIQVVAGSATGIQLTTQQNTVVGGTLSGINNYMTVANSATPTFGVGYQSRPNVVSGASITNSYTAYQASGNIGAGTIGAMYAFTSDATAGNWGVGTTQPSSMLEVRKDALATTQTNSSGISLVNNTNAALNAQQISPALRWRGSGWKTDATAGHMPVDFIADVLPVQGTAAPTGNWQLKASINGGAYSDIITATSGGFVGINTNSPEAQLDVRGTLQIKRSTASYLMLFKDLVTNNTVGNFQHTSSALALGFGTGSNLTMTVNETTTTKNFGIGTTTPSQKLDLTGNFKLTGGAFMPGNTAGTAGQVLTSGGAGVVPTWSSAGTGTIKGTVAATRVPFATGLDTLASSANFTYASSRVTSNSSSGAGFRTGYDATKYADFGATSAGDAYIMTNLSLTTGRRFGINTTSPSATLHADNPNKNDADLLMLDHSSDTMSVGSQNRIMFGLAGAPLAKMAAVKETSGYGLKFFTGDVTLNSSAAISISGKNVVTLGTTGFGAGVDIQGSTSFSDYSITVGNSGTLSPKTWNFIFPTAAATRTIPANMPDGCTIYVSNQGTGDTTVSGTGDTIVGDAVVPVGITGMFMKNGTAWYRIKFQ